MAMLPPSGWSDVATKQDLERFATKQEVAELAAATKEDLAELRIELHRELREFQRSFTFNMLAAMAANSTLIIGVLALLG